MENTLETLTAEKMIKASKQGKVLCYTFSEQSYKTPSGEAHLVKEPITDYADYNRCIMKLAHKKGNVTRADVTTLLHVSPAQAYRLLNRLKENGLLILEGKGKFSHYKPVC
jgi:ATP-dependent DNA helicase RecG